MSDTNALFQLPLDIVLRIFRYLNLKDLRNLMLTCKSLNNLIVSDNALWKIKCKSDLVIFDNLDEYDSLCWYHLYRLSYNWRRGIFSHQVVNYSKENFMPWLKFYDSQCLLLSLGRELCCVGVNHKGLPDFKNKFLWKIDVPIVHRRDIRTNDITRFVVKNKILVCGNRDGGAAVYDWESFRFPPKCIQHVENCHVHGLREVSAVELAGSDPRYLVTTSESSPEVKLWKIEEGYHGRRRKTTEYYKEFKLENAFGGKCLSIDTSQQKLAVGLDGNNRPQVIDIESGHACLNTEDTYNNYEVIRDINWFNNHTIYYTTHTGTLQFLDTRIGEVVYNQKEVFQAAMYCARSDGVNAVVAGSAQNARCTLYDLRVTGNYVQIYFVQKKSSSPVYSLDFVSSKLIAACDKTVSVMDFDVAVPASKKDFKDYSYQFHVIKNRGVDRASALMHN